MPSVFLIAALFSMPAQGPASMNGIALSLYYEDPAQGMSFDNMVDEIAETGADHISVVVQWAQPHTRASRVGPHPRETPSDTLVKRIVSRARKRGLKVMLFPILWVEKRAIGDWRGTLAPADPEAWWQSYGKFIEHYARLAQVSGAQVLSVGSEFASLEGERNRWVKLIGRVRSLFSGQILYSANWDHYTQVSFWDQVDLAGLTGYYRLTTNAKASVSELTRAWGLIRNKLLAWQSTMGRPLVFTELGYPSLDGAASSPWDYTTGKPLDLEEQRRCFRAFVDAWVDEPRLRGVFFWNWWGPGKGTDTWYTIKGKPAEGVMREWFRRRQSGSGARSSANLGKDDM